MSQPDKFAEDTIAAIATPPGRGGVGVIRISGPMALAIGATIRGGELPPRQAVFTAFREPGREDPLDQGLAIAFPGPDSFTGEDVVELHAHGSPVVLDLLLKACCDLGARLARPGEFSERAFLNDKMDLAQAEAVADLIASSTEAGARGAVRSLQGEFSRAVQVLMDKVVALRVYVEAAIDFPEEETDFLTEGDVNTRLAAILQDMERVIATAHQGQLIQEGMKLVIAGKPNAGKSSLLNALAGQDTAIVTDVAGTTRDVLRERIEVHGLPLHVFDTAGLRDSDSTVEQEGIRRARREMDSADRILLVVDGSVAVDTSVPGDAGDPFDHMLKDVPADVPVTVVHNKCDLSGATPGIEDRGGQTMITLSAKTGAGLDRLRQHLAEAMGFQCAAEPPFLARRRHLDAMERARGSLIAAQEQFFGAHGKGTAGELVAEDLRQCHEHLGAITGAFTENMSGNIRSDDLLGEIFSSFCIGK